jgi:hypothetical protein
MWWNLTSDDFVFSPNSLVNGIGLLAKEKCEIFDTYRKQLLNRVDEYKATVASPHYYLLSITRAMNHAGIHLGCLAASLIETKFGVTEFQCYYLEAVALLDYLQVYKPRMDGAATRPLAAGADNHVGVFTISARVAQEFYEAGLPVWFIRQTQKIAESTGCSPGPNVLKLVNPWKPADSVILADYNPPFPVIYVGHTNVAQKYACIHAYSRTWMVYQDTLSEECRQDTENPEDPFYATGKPATSSVTVPISDLMRESLPRCERLLFPLQVILNSCQSLNQTDLQRAQLFPCLSR